VDVDDLNEAERAVVAAFPRGGRVDLRTGDPVRDDPGNAEAWPASRIVRARVLAALLLGRLGAEGGVNPALRLRGARITGELDLPFAEINVPILLEQCRFDERPDLYWARTRLLSLNGSHLPGLQASNIQVDGHLRLSRCRITGGLRMPGGRVAASLIMDGASLRHPGETALAAEHLEIGGDLRAQDGFDCDGEIVLTSARVGAAVRLDDARLHAPGGLAFGGSNMTVQVGLFARGIHAIGEISVRYARVSGPLTLRGSRLSNPGGLAVRGGGLNAEGGLFLSLTEIEGQVRLGGAIINRGLNLDGAYLRNPGDVALRAHGCTVDGGLTARQGLRVDGEVVLADATITGPARFEGATLNNPGGTALWAAGVSVGKILNLCDGFTAYGRIVLTSARVGSRLCLDDAVLKAPGEVALKCWRLDTPELALRTAGTVEGAVDLRHARVGVLRDRPEAWPARLRCDGLSYEVLDPMLPAARRLDWLARDPDGYLPNAYERLSAMYRDLGSEKDARDIALAGQRRRRATLPRLARIWGHLQDVTVGYGYRPLRAGAWLLALLTVGAVVFGGSEPPAFDPGAAPPFNPVIYTLDLLLPIIDFGQERAFNPVGAQQWLAWGLIAAGWVLATTIAAGLTRSLRRG